MDDRVLGVGNDDIEYEESGYLDPLISRRE